MQVQGLRIGEVARLAGVSSATLRLWESQGLIQPIRSSGGIRRYRPEDVEKIQKIVALREEHGLNPRTIAHFLAHDTPQSHSPVTRSQTTKNEATIARGLRRERRELGLTLREVSERTGISISHLSAIEREQQYPSLSTLLSLTQSYGIMIQDLFGNRGKEGRLVRASERLVYPGVEKGVVIEQLTIGPTRIEAQIFNIPSGAESGGFYAHPGEEFILVLSGHFKFWLGDDEPVQMQAGDSICFPSTVVHRWSNPGRESARVLWSTVSDSDPRAHSQEGGDTATRS